MNRKWSGSAAGIYIILMISSLLLFSCTKDIPGNPKKTVEHYIAAVQKSDFETIYKMNRATARQKKYIEKSKSGDIEQELMASFKTHKEAYDAVEPGFFSGAQWSEKYLFPPTAKVVVGEARHPSPAPDDPEHVQYEKGFTAFVSVRTLYTTMEDAPELYGRKVQEATYDCALGKIRYGDNVRVYSHDEQWFFTGCILERDSVTYFKLQKPNE